MCVCVCAEWRDRNRHNRGRQTEDQIKPDKAILVINKCISNNIRERNSHTGWTREKRKRGRGREREREGEGEEEKEDRRKMRIPKTKKKKTESERASERKTQAEAIRGGMANDGGGWRWPRQQRRRLSFGCRSKVIAHECALYTTVQISIYSRV